MERRYLESIGDEAIELREEGSPVIRGYAAVFGKKSHDLGGFVEILQPTAFDSVLASRKLDVVGLWNHDPSQILGRTTSGTLRLAVDERGLSYEIDPPDTQLGRDSVTLLRRRDVSASSFAFSVDPKNETWDQPEKGLATRTISSVSGLFDVSIVTHPAYPQTSVAVRSLETWREASATLTRAVSPITISIDYDGTFSAAPGLWRSFASTAKAAGHTVVMISRRANTDENMAEVSAALGDSLGEFSGVILCGPESSKRSAAGDAGISVDVWIDDAPATVDTLPAVRGVSLSVARASAAVTVARIAANVRAQ